MKLPKTLIKNYFVDENNKLNVLLDYSKFCNLYYDNNIKDLKLFYQTDNFNKKYKTWEKLDAIFSDISEEVSFYLFLKEEAL